MPWIYFSSIRLVLEHFCLLSGLRRHCRHYHFVIFQTNLPAGVLDIAGVVVAEDGGHHGVEERGQVPRDRAPQRRGGRHGHQGVRRNIAGELCLICKLNLSYYPFLLLTCNCAHSIAWSRIV